MKIRELLTDKTKWTKGYRARTAAGTGVNPDSPSATCWCLTGAVLLCYPDSIERMQVFLKIVTEIGQSIVAWNDRYTRTFDEVHRLINELDI